MAGRPDMGRGGPFEDPLTTVLVLGGVGVLAYLALRGNSGPATEPAPGPEGAPRSAAEVARALDRLRGLVASGQLSPSAAIPRVRGLRETNFSLRAADPAAAEEMDSRLAAFQGQLEAFVEPLTA